MQDTLLIDGMNLAFRSHYAFNGLSFEDKPTGMLYGALKAITRLRAVTSRIVVCWDCGSPPEKERTPSWRKEYYPKYKANRQPSEGTEHVFAQLPALHNAIKLLGYQSIGVPLLEADDLIGLLSSEHYAASDSVLVYSSDHDFYQLLSKRVKILKPGTGSSFTRLRASEVEATYSVPVAKWADYLCLGGDTCDNIKPIPNVGPTRAAEMVNAGAIPNKPWAYQPDNVKLKYSKYQTHWNTVQRAYQITKLPRKASHLEGRISDLRLKALTANLEVWQHPMSLDRTEPDAKAWLKFCGGYGFDEFIATRRKILA